MKASKGKQASAAALVTPTTFCNLTLDEQGGVSIRSTTLRSVEFFTKHAQNPQVQMLAVQILDSVVDCMHNYMSAETSRRETNAVLDFLQAMEQRQKVAFKGLAADAADCANSTVEQLQEGLEGVCAKLTAKTCEVGDKVLAKTCEVGDKILVKNTEIGDRLYLRSEDVVTRLAALQSGVDSIGGKVQQQVMALISTVDNAVRASVEKLNVDTIATMVSDSVRKWLQGEVDGLKEGQQTAAGCVRDLESRLRESILHVVSEPQAARHEHLLGMLQSLPAQMTHLCVQATAEACLGKDSEARERLAGNLAEMRVRLDEALAMQAREVLENKTAVTLVNNKVQHVIDNVARMWADTKERSIESKTIAATNLGQVPMVLKAVLNDTLKALETQSHNIKGVVYGTQLQLVKMERDLCDSLGTLQVLRKGADDVTCKVEALGQQFTVSQVKQANSQRIKGQVGESKLFDVLSERLTARDNYSIDTVNGQAHACDLNIKKLGCPDVRIECKAHGEQTGEKVDNWLPSSPRSLTSAAVSLSAHILAPV